MNPKKILPIECVTLLYLLFTTLCILLLGDEMRAPGQLLLGRFWVLLGMVGVYVLNQFHPHRHTLFLRYLYPLTLLGYWYPDTYEFCQLFPNLDHVFAAADAALFGCQPSIEFSKMLPQKLWSELFHMGYFSYYPMIFCGVLLPLFLKGFEAFRRSSFVVLTAFFLYYLIYLFLPVTGPQYYFCAVGEDIIQGGHFPQLFDYFRYHTEMLPSPGPEGMFRTLVESSQATGERPTAAFPSSHVGIGTILLFLIYRSSRLAAAITFPFYVLLCGATVYIQAHYLVDVFGGWVTAVVFYMLLDKMWDCMAKSSPVAERTSRVEK